MNTRADTLHEPPERADIAAEYVLGVLTAAERRSAENRIVQDSTFAREITAWEARLMPLIDEIALVPAPFALWPRVRAAVGIGAADQPAPFAANRPTLWQSTPFWRWLSAGAFAAAAASLIVLFVAPRLALLPVQAPMVAKMVQDDGKALFLATVDARHGTMVVQPTTVEIPKGRVAELWLIPPGDSPHSLGLLDPLKANRWWCRGISSRHSDRIRS
jgi:anti-sigma-K factor RskA